MNNKFFQNIFELLLEIELIISKPFININDQLMILKNPFFNKME